jgi:hypothetical protein
MSRLRALHVPFLAGVDDRVDSKLLPDGTFSDLVNGRFLKQGQLALRRGWRPVTMLDTDGTTVAARDLYSYNGGLVALAKSSHNLPQLAAYANPTSARPWYVPGSNTLSPATDVRSVGGVPASDLAVNRASAALTSDSVYGAVVTVTNAGTPGAQVRIFRVDTDETLLFTSLANATQNPKVVSLGAKFGLVRNTGAALTLEIADPALATGPAFAAPVTLVSVVASDFDAVTPVPSASGANPDGVYVSWVEAAAIKFAKFSLAGVQAGSTKTVKAAGQSYTALATDATRVHCVYQDTVAQTLELLTFDATSPYATTAGPTAVLASAAVLAWFSVGCEPTGGGGRAVVVAQSQAELADPENSDVFIRTRNAAHTVSSTATRGGTTLAGGVIFTPGADSTPGAAFTASRDHAFVCFDCSSVGSLWFALHGLGDDEDDQTGLANPPYAPAQAPDGTSIVFGRTEAAQVIVRVLKCDADSRRQGVALNGQLHVAGGKLTRWDGTMSSETAFLAPVITGAVASNGSGTLTVSSVYSYRAIMEWVDARGVTTQGEVSTEFSMTTGVADDTGTLTIQIPPAMARTSNLVVGPSLKLFRTEAGPGELFYLTKTVEDVSRTTDEVSVTDTTSDAALVDNERLYTEGDTGATSGRLDNVLPRPSRYVAAARDRLVLASRTPEYQLSQVALPSEPVANADPGVSGPVALVYFDQAPEDITAVATLDDSIVVASKRALVVTSGDGPNLAGVGEFASPARLPSNVGVYDWRSVVESADGLWFLGDSTKLFVLPRGQGTPEWAGESVQDRFAAAVVGAGLDSRDQVLGWAVADATLVVRDLANKAWTRDGLPFTPRAFVAHDGHFWAVASDGVVWEHSTASYGDAASGATAVALTVTSGDVTVFGLGGHGRLATVELLGEFQAAAAILAEISYDLGQTWTSLGTHTVTGLSAGQAFQRSWAPARQRGGKFRVRFTMTPSVTTTEGCRLTGYTVYFDQRSGPTRLDSAKKH